MSSTWLGTAELPGGPDASEELPGRRGSYETPADGGGKDTKAREDENEMEFVLLLLLQTRAVWDAAVVAGAPGEMVSFRL